MSDSYPESFTIEIEREKLCRYLRRLWVLLPCVLFIWLGAMFGLAWTLGDEPRKEFDSVMDVVIAFCLGPGLGVAIGVMLVVSTYFLFIHRAAKRYAESWQVSVEGPFLRIKEGVSSIQDRKLHFRAIIDYTYFQDSAMRKCGIEGIELTTMAGGQNSTIRIKGIKNALEVRDMLSEIDRQRENS